MRSKLKMIIEEWNDEQNGGLDGASKQLASRSE